MTEEEYSGRVLMKAEKVAGGFEKIADWEINFFNRTNENYFND